MIQGIEHIAIFSKDTTGLKDWYIRLFGFSQVYDNGKETYFLAAPDGSMIEFVKSTEEGGDFTEKTCGIRHLALTVEDFDGMVDVLMKENVSVIAAPIVSASGIKTFFFKDPQGNVLHLIYRPTPLI